MLGAYIFSERPFFDKKYRFRHAQQFAESASAGAPIAPPSFYLSVFAQVKWGSGAFPPSSAVEPGFLVNPGFLLVLRSLVNGIDQNGGVGTLCSHTTIR